MIKTFTQIDAAMKDDGFEGQGQDGCLNHIYKHADGREYSVGRSFFGGYEAVLTQGPKEGHFMDAVIDYKDSTGCDWSEALAAMNVD